MRWNETDYSGWGRALRATGRIARPEKVATLMDILSEGGGPAIGQRRSYGDEALNTGGSVIDMTRLNRFLSFDGDNGVLEAEAGVTIADILRTFVPHGWCPGVMPGTGLATLGGCIANDVHGKNHHLDGSFGTFVDSIELLTPDGRKTRVSRARHKEMFRATLGGLGQTGIILSARLRLIPCASGTMRVDERRVENLGAFIEALSHSTARYSVGWIDATAKGARLGRGVLEEAEIAETGPEGKSKKPLPVPADAPGFVLSPLVVRLFNQAYFNRVPEPGRQALRPMQSFFFPLDRLHNWNRLYGKQGFHQFQCVVPEDGAETVLSKMLSLIAGSGRASPLAVLKRLGAQGDGMLSFPTRGYTLAVDIRNRGPVAALFDELEELTLAAGGRIYAAKDSLGSAERFAASYPELPAFRQQADKADPDGALITDLVRRLGIRGQA